MRWLIPIGLGAAIAAVVISTHNKNKVVGSNRIARNVDPRFRSPGQPQPPSYNVDSRTFARTVTFG